MQENDDGDNGQMILYRVDDNADFDDNTEGAILPNTDLGPYPLAIFTIVRSEVGTRYRYVALLHSTTKLC